METKYKRALTAGAIGLGGVVAGVVLAGTLTAGAAESTESGTPTPNGSKTQVDQSKSQRPDEHLLTGTTADKVKAAALAKYPGATILRVETDSDGVYEAHMTMPDGTPVTVEVGKDFTVTGEEQGGPGGHGGPGGRGGPGDHDGDGPGAAAPGA